MKIIAASLLAVAALSVGACGTSNDASNATVVDNTTVTDEGFEPDNAVAPGDEPGNAIDANASDPASDLALDNATVPGNGVAANIQ